MSLSLSLRILLFTVQCSSVCGPLSLRTTEYCPFFQQTLHRAHSAAQIEIEMCPVVPMAHDACKIHYTVSYMYPTMASCRVTSGLAVGRQLISFTPCSHLGARWLICMYSLEDNQQMNTRGATSGATKAMKASGKQGRNRWPATVRSAVCLGIF